MLFHIQRFSPLRTARFYGRYFGLPRWHGGKQSNAGDARDVGLIPWSGRSPGEGNGNPLQYCAWEIPGTGEPGRLQPMGLQRVGHDLELNNNKW